LRRILREWRVEIILSAALALAAFLLLERMDIRATLWSGLNRLVDAAGAAALRVLGLVMPTTLSDLVGLLLVIGVAILAAWRLRWRLMRSPSLTGRVCPRCGSSLKRIHRKPLDRAINTIIVPIHRYTCSNSTCRWRGLRVDAGLRGSDSHEEPAASEK
jgi:hypothetical protein